MTPLIYLPDDERYIIFASKSGAPTNPDRYYNLTADPQATIELGRGTIPVIALTPRPEPHAVLGSAECGRRRTGWWAQWRPSPAAQAALLRPARRA